MIAITATTAANATIALTLRATVTDFTSGLQTDRRIFAMSQGAGKPQETPPPPRMSVPET
jgi:hypothetical protein